jgi:hypothetical protein
VGRFVTAAAREVKHGLGLGRRDADLMRDYTHIGFTFPATHEDAETSLAAGALPDLV